jgi:pSer/pThr/pTyr-binding forkhead associated (FHA) protein
MDPGVGRSSAQVSTIRIKGVGVTFSSMVRRFWLSVVPGKKNRVPEDAGSTGIVPATVPALDMTTSLALLNLPEATERESDAGASGVDQATLDALPRESALLVVQRGPTAGARYLLQADSTTAGRHPQSEIFLNDATVSRKHAEFLRRDGQFLVRDVGTLNGTYVNRDRIEAETALRDGDEVQIGKYRLVFYPGRHIA